MNKKVLTITALIVVLVIELFILTGCSKNNNTDNIINNEQKILVENVISKPTVAEGMTEKTIGELSYQYPSNIRFLDYKSNDNNHMFHLYPMSEEETIVNLYIKKFDAKGRKIEDITTGVYVGLDSKTDITGTKEINGAIWTTAHKSYYSKSNEADYEAYGYGIIIDGIAYHVSLDYEKGVEGAEEQAKKIENSLWFSHIYK